MVEKEASLKLFGKRFGLIRARCSPQKAVSVAVPDYGINLRDLNMKLNVAETISESPSGDKLGGWPIWVKGEEIQPLLNANSRWNLLLIN